MTHSLNRFLQDERGLETVEYAIVAALIVSGLVAIIIAIGQWVHVRYERVHEQLSA